MVFTCVCGHDEQVHEVTFYQPCTECECEMFAVDAWEENQDYAE